MYHYFQRAATHYIRDCEINEIDCEINDSISRFLHESVGITELPWDWFDGISRRVTELESVVSDLMSPDPGTGQQNSYNSTLHLCCNAY